MDERTLQYKRATGSHPGPLWAYCTHSTHDVNDVMCEGWPHHWGLCPLHFSNSGVCSFMSHKNQMSASAVKWDLRFFL